MLRFYERTLDVALKYQFITLMVFVGTVALTVVLYVIIPKGFFPTQDTGIIIGITGCGAGYLLRRHGGGCSSRSISSCCTTRPSASVGFVGWCRGHIRSDRE